MTKRVNVVGAGLIGGSISLGLQAAGWETYISDHNPELTERAVADQIAGHAGLEPDADITVIATPVGQVSAVVKQVLAEVDGVVTDVGSTKADICIDVDNPRFIGGHPMAGSEQSGLGGARPDLFAGAIWVLTPGEFTDDAAVRQARSVIAALGAELLMLPPLVHDQLVAKVSHVPHLTAATLMNLAEASAVDQRVLLRLAAGGFRDMTRVSAGHPAIWPDICLTNRTAIITGLEELIGLLTDVKRRVESGDRDGLLAMLNTAREARLNLPVGFDPADSLVELSVLVPDEPGQIAVVARLAADHDINIYDLEIAHSAEGSRGVMVLLVNSTRADRFRQLLTEHGYHSSERKLG